ncbi:MAG: hypothetical protein ABF289_18585 [Clostridiales bacterium]
MNSSWEEADDWSVSVNSPGTITSIWGEKVFGSRNVTISNDYIISLV